MSNPVPQGWSAAELTKFCEVVGGGTPDRSVEEYWNGDIPWASPTEITSRFSKHISRTKDRITQKGLEKSSAKLHPAGTVLMTSRASIGYVAINTVPMATNQGFQSLRCKENASADYIYQHITWIRPELEKMSAGSTFSEISSSSVKRLRVTLPPLPEQQKIAAILSSVDDVIEKTRAQIDKLKDLKTGMMQELLTKGIGSGGVPHTEFRDSPVGRIPARWDVVPIDSIVSKVVDNRGKTPPLSKEGIELLEINTISKDRVNPDYRKVRKFVSPETYSSWFRAGHPKGGDILIPTVGTIGACSLVEQDRGSIAQNIIALRLCKSIDPHFAYYILSSEPTVRQIESILMNAVQPSLRVPHFLMLKIALPSLSEQKIISASLLSIDKRLERLTGKIESINLMKKALMQDLLTGKVRVKVDQKESAVA